MIAKRNAVVRGLRKLDALPRCRCGAHRLCSVVRPGTFLDALVSITDTAGVRHAMERCL